MRTTLQLTNKNWHEIAEVTLYTIIGWEVILFFLYVFTKSGYKLEIGLPISWFLCGVLQVWAIKHTLSQFSLKSTSLIVVGWGIVPFLLMVFYNISEGTINYSLFLTLGCLIGQILQIVVIKYAITQISIKPVLLTSLGWFLGCCLWFIGFISHNTLVGASCLIAGMLMGGIGSGITSYVLFPFQQQQDNYEVPFYRRYFKILPLMGIIFLHWILIIFIPPSHPPGIQETQMKMRVLENVLDAYRLDYWQYPTTEQGLKALMNKPTEEDMLKRWHGHYFHRELPKDSWNNNFQYESDGTTYELISFGFDGHAGGGDDIRETSGKK